MANQEIHVKIQEAYDTEGNWRTINPVLLEGQLAFSSDKYGKYKMGDGTSRWNELEYISANWDDISGKPSSFNPTAHYHDDRYYSITELDEKLSKKANAYDLDQHMQDTTNHVHVSERTNWNNASNHANSTHAPVNAEQNQNAFSYIYVNGYTISADTKMDILNLEAGTGITITPDTVYDKITISADSMNCTLEDLGVTATAQELNYVKGVTSNIQDQLSHKASIYHSHSGEYASVNHTHTASQISGLPTIEAITDSEIDSLKYL